MTTPSYAHWAQSFAGGDADGADRLESGIFQSDVADVNVVADIYTDVDVAVDVNTATVLETAIAGPSADVDLFNLVDVDISTDIVTVQNLLLDVAINAPSLPGPFGAPAPELTPAVLPDLEG